VSIIDWSGVWAPAKTPQTVVQTVNAAMRKVLTREDLRKTATTLSLGVAGASVQDIRAKMAAELKLWKSVAEKAHISVKL
jgi:tripartite-type tricarboxylate transporter receptor subunit TctC